MKKGTEKGTHFFDLASWISAMDPVEIYAAGACLIDKRFADYELPAGASIISASGPLNHWNIKYAEDSVP